MLSRCCNRKHIRCPSQLAAGRMVSAGALLALLAVSSLSAQTAPAGSGAELDEYDRPAGATTASGGDRCKSIPSLRQSIENRWCAQNFSDDLGGLPDYNGPLNPEVTGEIRTDSYTIEKVIYESLPGFYVTANVYRPNLPGRYPAVLLQSGHTQEGKPENQRVAANLAMKGFVVLCFDPIGQGERVQTYSRQLDAPLAGWSVPEHIEMGAQAQLIGQGLARYFIWDAMRSLDYLASRPDVDASRIGAAGCSGGGALTTFTGALDPRLKVVIPGCYPSSFQLLFSTFGPGC